MKIFLSNFISKIKGENFSLDENIPLGYLVRNIIFKRIIMYFRGFISFRKISPKIFIDRKTKLICKSKIKSNGTISIGRNCYIDALSINGIEFGKNVSIGANSTIECSGSLKDIGKGLKVGSNVGLGTHGFLGCAGGIDIGDDTIFGNFVSMHSENHNYKDKDIPIRLQGVNRKGIKIGNNCWIGAKVTILDGVMVEDGCIIAAGSLLTEGVYKKDSIYGGIPAKFLKERF